MSGSATFTIQCVEKDHETGPGRTTRWAHEELRAVHAGRSTWISVAICDQTLGCASDGVQPLQSIRAEWSTAAEPTAKLGQKVYTAGVSQLGEPIPLTPWPL